MADTIHCIKKTLRLKPCEAKLLARQAKAFKLSEAAYLRLLIRQKPNDYPEIRRLIAELTNEVNHIGVNINQIAKNNNMNFYSKEDKESLLAYRYKLNELLKEVVIKIGNQ